MSKFEIGVNAALLAKLAKSMGTDVVRIQFVSAPDSEHPSALKPMVVRPPGAGENDPTGILMPVRLSS